MLTFSALRITTQNSPTVISKVYFSLPNSGPFCTHLTFPTPHPPDIIENALESITSGNNQFRRQTPFL